MRTAAWLAFACGCLGGVAHAVSSGGQAPDWLHAVVNAPALSHRDDNAVLLYSETNVTVLSEDKIRTHVRGAYKILRPAGREHGTVAVYVSNEAKVLTLRGWCIPAQGKDYEVGLKDAIEQAPLAVPGYELVTDTRRKLLQVPAPNPGNVIGYEYETEEKASFLQNNWQFQGFDPVRESHFSLELPDGWEYKAAWINHLEVSPTQSGRNRWEWVVKDVEPILREEQMPPVRGIAGMMIVSFFPAGGSKTGSEFSDWKRMGQWYSGLTSDRGTASPQIKSKVAEITAGKSSTLDKMRAISQFVQSDIRYVAIELGIGGWQPHPAADVFSVRYGDCKDKATLVRTMLREIGVDSYYVIINASRGAITQDMPAHNGFDHAINAIRLPDDVNDASLVAVIRHPKLGRILFFDPTDELTNLGQIRGQLQDNYGLLVTANSGELIKLPEQPPALSGTQRLAKLTLGSDGKLRGEVRETQIGDRASAERFRQRNLRKESDRLKPLEDLLADAFGSFSLLNANFAGVESPDHSLNFSYSFEAPAYGQSAGDMLLVRPRVLGKLSSGLLETSEPRRSAIEFKGPSRDSDTFEITIPNGYAVENMSPPADVDFGFASYHAKSELSGNTLRYIRTLEIKELSVPVSKADDLKKFYRIIATDERATAVLKRRLQAASGQ